MTVVIAQIALFSLAGQPGIPPMRLHLDRVSEGGPDVVYLGDSCVNDHAPDDTDTRSLPVILDAKPALRKVEGAAGNAYHGEMFRGMCDLLARGNNLPSAVILPINMRSFSV